MISSLVKYSKDKDLIEIIQGIIERNFGDEEFDVEKLRLAVNLSDSKLYSLFKKEFGDTAKLYLLNRRLDEAMLLLQDYKLNIAQISFKVGIKNPSYFSTSFKKRFKKTPTEVMSERINRKF